MGFKITNIVSSKGVPKWGNAKKYIAVHYLGVDGQNNDLAPDGTGAHYYIYWDGTIYQRCSHDAILWQVGTAGGAYTQKHPLARNANTIGIEMCCHCDGNKALASDPKWYFTKETQEACVWLVQKLMKELNIPAANVLRHFDIVNKTCPAPYVHNNKYKTSWTWEEFKSRIIGASLTLYRVRIAWDKPETQLNAYYDLDNAKAEADAHPGFSVFDETGKCVYTSKQGQEAGYTPEAWINLLAPDAQDIASKNGLLASVMLAQASLETGWGKTDLAQRHNIFGMKADLINSTWDQWSTWDHSKWYEKLSPEEENGKVVMRKSRFRVYDTYRQCMEDYAAFLLHVQNNKGYKYACIKGWTDPAKVIHRIRIGTGTDAHPEGYATDSGYETKVMNLIRTYNLTRFDSVAPQPTPEPTPQPANVMYRVQVEADRSLEEAQKTIAYIWEATKWKEKWKCFAEKSDGWWKVICGSFFDKKNAEARKAAIIQKFAAKGLYQDTFITEIKT